MSASPIIDWGLLWVAMDRVPGVSPVNKFGRNTDIDTATTPEDLWGGGGVYAGFPENTAEPIEVLSDSASDASAGVGARTVVIQGLNSDWLETSEAITLNGLTPVQSVNTYRRVHTMRVATSGSSVFNVGTITVRHATTEANVFLTMVPNTNQTNCSAYTVPAGKSAYLTDVIAIMRGAVNGTADMAFWIRAFGQAPRLRRPFAVSSNFEHHDEISVPIQLAEKTDIIIRCTTVSTNNLEVAAGYDLVLVKN